MTHLRYCGPGSVLLAAQCCALVRTVLCMFLLATSPAIAAPTSFEKDPAPPRSPEHPGDYDSEQLPVRALFYMFVLSTRRFVFPETVLTYLPSFMRDDVRLNLY